MTLPGEQVMALISCSLYGRTLPGGEAIHSGCKFQLPLVIIYGNKYNVSYSYKCFVHATIPIRAAVFLPLTGVAAPKDDTIIGTS